MATPRPGNFIFDKVAIVGVGLIGGSLGLAIKKRALAKQVIGIGRTEQKLMRAKILGAIDDYSLDFENGAIGADLVIICTPVRDVVPTLEKMAASLSDGAIVTDVGSTKREIVREAKAVMPEKCFFIGGHPMAGSEQGGVDAASADLFVGATYILTPSDDTSVMALSKMTALCDALGANVEDMSPEDHDKAVAVISHLPHAMSSALLQLAGDSQRSSGKVFSLAAGSFRDLTRISDSSPELWRDICITNADCLIEAITMFQQYLEDFKKALEARDDEAARRFFEESRILRQMYLRISE